MFFDDLFLLDSLFWLLVQRLLVIRNRRALLDWGPVTLHNYFICMILSDLGFHCVHKCTFSQAAALKGEAPPGLPLKGAGQDSSDAKSEVV